MLNRHDRPMRRLASTVLQDRRTLLVIFATALILRALCAIFFSGEIDGEGAEYARIAENIRGGMGYKGIATAGDQLFFPPLFSLLIAGISMLGFTAEAAGRLVNILSGALLVLPVFGIAKRMFGRTIGLGAAAIVALHPFLVTFSTTVYCEPLFLALILAAVLTGMRAADRSDLRPAAAAGLLYGLAYLVRPEAMIFMLVGLAFLILQRGMTDRLPFVRTVLRDVPRAALMVGCFALFILPYVTWLSRQTGELTLQTKSILNMATELRMRSGMSTYEASFAVNPEMKAEGTYNRPNIDVIKNGRPDFRQYLKIVPKKTIDVLRSAAAFTGGAVEFGSPALFGLAMLGLFGRPWGPRRFVDEVHLIALLALTSFALFFIYYTSHPRFFVLFLAVSCIWASAGLWHFAEWAHLTLSPHLRSERWLACVAPASIALGLAAMMLPAALFAIKELTSMHGLRPVKALAMSLASKSEPITIADTMTPFAFHAKADFVWLPHSDEATALRYLALKGVTHVIARSDGLDEVPYLRSWSRNGVPDGELVAQVPYSNGKLVQLFRLQRPD
ncbi:ArnT family glycosyltransferase [Bosea sp. TAF32]|uniref:ArnT family glycosyltransferase n=1 Tax=Bosea sp. TAF32 TaxID=3237482 RepID=UPI003F8F57C7